MPSFFFLNLTAILVGGERLTVPPTIFSRPGTILDSDTMFSHLPPTTYSALRIFIIGNMQHLTLNVVYDVGNSQIGFGPNGCS
ncbi:aspartyl protease family protein At5g10770-like [Dendrobium catenatum]|uniref:aspartyl protease family protein At5g10770-like n=1 Tax=Dendrobium catenatum TaxID=906689 RepID=UPI0010A08458|nr:aspartyl protease family protein At5g10770-like [Dendrobium catenatum]